MKTAGLAESKLTNLGNVVRCFEPFKEKNLAEFNDFLQSVVDHYAQNGTFPEVGKPPKPKSSKGPKPPKVTVPEAAQKFMSLYEAAAEPGLDYSTIDREIDAFNGSMGADELRQLGKEVGLELTKKASKPMVLAELKRKVKERKENRERNPARSADSTQPVGATSSS